MTSRKLGVDEGSRELGLPRPIVGELKLDRSNALLADARRLIPGVTQSLMKRPEMYALGSFPVYLETGEGALVRDVDGNEYIDYICGLGANTLGHNHPAVVRAIREPLGNGVLHSLPTEIEVTATRALVDLIPGAEMARFFKTGADATSAAIRLARHVTGREKVVTIGYNGWHDHFMFDTPGVPAVLRDYTYRMPLMAEAEEQPLLDLIAQKGSEIALVLLSLPYKRIVSAEFLRTLRETCHAHGVLFVLDEVVTGFRLALGGAQEYYGIAADFVCLSKGIAAGMPLSAIAGPREVMSRLAELQVSTTFGGEMLSLEVCKAVLGEYRDTDYIQRIASLGKRLREGINEKSKKIGTPLRVVGYDAIPFFLFADDLPTHTKFAAQFVGAMATRGVLLRRDVSFISGVHTQAQIDFTIDAAHDALTEMAKRGAFEGSPAGARS
ncbi:MULTISPECIES: aspartate aminotransferase family protein [Polyangium]|uniref:Aminotransferase class III-fold pyridoxal phosphate-dependent enzyme n=2 Tax=Polyangium TaxID=55 RepID=A0A4U1JGX1_9BACT|nr:MULTISPECIES: aminotransferase class III-fold pyridoxal phosphate-dependent enzyme [Polyangium]MDI1428620.1 aminotransferase class III-fold pyridoxal phosphate-dependent enzyme [Polyangium sorediatum]TKD11802.1 aminotransferase class III-fold pyridoxal phosphate-dependent enzyme [Polyangium fumosum]